LQNSVPTFPYHITIRLALLLEQERSLMVLGCGIGPFFVNDS